MRVLIVGGTGHIGSYLVPRLVREGCDVVVVARNPAPRYADPRIGWGQVEWLLADRTEEEKTGAWEERMRGVKADVVVDLMCFLPEQNAMMVRAFEGRIDHFIHCGTLWAYGPSARTPYREEYPRRPITDYGRNKARIEADLLALQRRTGFPATIIHPGHISAKGWMIIDPRGTINDMGVYEALATGDAVHLPNLGRETVHHVHGDDVAQMFQLALERREQALGESFSCVAPYAMSLEGCCECVAGFFDRKPNLEFHPLADLRGILGEKTFECVKTHVEHSPCSSIDKARRMLGYAPRFTTEEIYAECVEEMLRDGRLQVG